MNIKVMTRDTVEKEVATSTKKIAVISITNKWERVIPFAANENLLGVHRMKFDDKYTSKGNGPVQNDFNGLRSFVDEIFLDAEELIVHCAAGISRSPAVAEAIYKYLEDKDEVTYEEPEYRYEPNPLVFKFACYELGLEEPE